MDTKLNAYEGVLFEKSVICPVSPFETSAQSGQSVKYFGEKSEKPHKNAFPSQIGHSLRLCLSFYHSSGIYYVSKNDKRKN